MFTVGHSTHPIDAFVEILQAHGVKQLVDIRTIPKSRHNPQFNQETLSASLRKQKIAYVHMKDLGGLRRPHPDSPNAGWKNSSFRGYADYMQTGPFKEALDKLIAVSKKHPTAIMCAEALPWKCHRSLVSDSLTAKGIPVEHLLSPQKRQPHTMTPFAKVQNGELLYPKDKQQLELFQPKSP